MAETTTAPAPQPQQAKDEMQKITEQLLQRVAQPRTQIQPPVPPKQPQQMQGHNFVGSLFSVIYNAAQGQKQQQLRHATGVLSQLNNSWQKSQDLAQGDQQKAMQIFSTLPEVTHILEDKKNVKQLGKILQFDFMDPEKKKTIWHEALGKVVEAGKALGLTQAIKAMMGKHKESQQQPSAPTSGPDSPAGKEQQASATAQKIAGMGVLEKPQMTVIQEIKAMNDSIKNERENLKAEQANLNKQRELGLKEDEFSEKKKEFEQKEKDFDRRQTSLDKYRGELIKQSRERLTQAGANTDLRRIVTAINYAPQLLKPGEAEAFGMEIDQDGNLIPAKSPMAATTTERNAVKQAGVMDSLIDTTLKVLDDPDLQNKLGPFQGRLSEIIQGKVGANIPEFDTLRTLGSFDASGMLKLHFGQRGGQQMYDKIHNLLDTGKMDIASLRESLNAFKTVAKTYKKQVRTARDKNTPETKANEGEVVIDLTKPKKTP